MPPKASPIPQGSPVGPLSGTLSEEIEKKIIQFAITGRQLDDIRKILLITGSDNPDAAMSYMKSCAWRLEQAVVQFYTLNPHCWSNQPSLVNPVSQKKDKITAIRTLLKPYLLEPSIRRGGELVAVLDQLGSGLDEFLRQLAWELDDPILLALWHFCGVKHMHEITEPEIVAGFLFFDATTFPQLKQALEAWRPNLKIPEACHSLYLGTFEMVTIPDIGQQQRIQKADEPEFTSTGRRNIFRSQRVGVCLETELAIEYWKIFVPLFNVQWFDEWCQFLIEERKVPTVNKDLWVSVWLLFSKFDVALDAYDIRSSSFPVILDDFVEFYRKIVNAESGPVDEPDKPKRRKKKKLVAA